MRQKFVFIFLCIILGLFMANVYAQNHALVIEAEDADNIGSDYNIVTEGDILYITPSTNYVSTSNPGTDEKVALFEITFAAPGSYDLYIRLRVGPNTYDDDSFYFASSFGTRPSDVNSLWVTANGLDFGATGPDEYVLGPEENTARFGIFKWINASEWGGRVFEVKEDSLNQFFMIGAREDGLDIDKIAFGNASLYYTVSNLENGEAGVTEIPGIDSRLVVNLADSLRPVTHAASGALWGVSETNPADVESMVAPLNPRMYVQPARSGAGHQHSSLAAAAIPVAERLASTSAEVTIRLADINPNFPYTFIGWEAWETEVRGVIQDKIDSGLDNYYGYEIWNEQHGTWDEEANGGAFFSTLWEPTYDIIRSLDPEANIIGPSDSYYTRSRMNEFLTYCIGNDCLPDIISWHELGGSSNVSRNIENYRSLENQLGVEPRPVSINEYSSPTHAYEGAPGPSASFIAKFERSGVHSAAISWWFPPLTGVLGSLLTSSRELGGGWWFYKWYGEMSGHMVTVTPPDPNSDALDGFANLDIEEEFASVCFGGDYRGASVDVEINGIPAVFGDSVDVMVQYVPWSDKDEPVSGPVNESLLTYDNSEGSIIVPVEVKDPLYGYRVYISPVGQTIAVKDQKNIPDAFELRQNYPNPFNPETIIVFSVPERQFVSLKVLNALGKEVIHLVNGHYSAGRHAVVFDASNLTSGVYFYTLRAGDFVQSRKMMVVK